ncbi:MAG: YARHG domain-containing protein [Lachnospiraceae bacterium]|nr:YARHG domain-containing protein [Lachnospiraceae bacterium]
MKKHPYLPAGILGVMDLLLVGLAVGLLTGSSGKSEAAAGKAAVDQTEQSELAESHTSSFTGLITAEISAESTPEPTPVPTPEATPVPTAAPTPTPTPEPEESTEISGSDFIFPESDSTVLTEAQVRAAVSTKAQCQRAVNEIYARHGYQFHREKNASDYDYFMSLGWYQSMTKTESASAVEAQFNAVEKANIDLLLAVRETLG